MENELKASAQLMDDVVKKALAKRGKATPPPSAEKIDDEVAVKAQESEPSPAAWPESKPPPPKNPKFFTRLRDALKLKLARKEEPGAATSPIEENKEAEKIFTTQDTDERKNFFDNKRELFFAKYKTYLKERLEKEHWYSLGKKTSRSAERFGFKKEKWPQSLQNEKIEYERLREEYANSYRKDLINLINQWSETKANVEVFERLIVDEQKALKDLRTQVLSERERGRLGKAWDWYVRQPPAVKVLGATVLATGAVFTAPYWVPAGLPVVGALAAKYAAGGAVMAGVYAARRAGIGFFSALGLAPFVNMVTDSLWSRVRNARHDTRLNKIGISKLVLQEGKIINWDYWENKYRDKVARKEARGDFYKILTKWFIVTGGSLGISGYAASKSQALLENVSPKTSDVEALTHSKGAGRLLDMAKQGAKDSEKYPNLIAVDKDFTIQKLFNRMGLDTNNLNDKLAVDRLTELTERGRVSKEELNNLFAEQSRSGLVKPLTVEDINREVLYTLRSKDDLLGYLKEHFPQEVKGFEDNSLFEYKGWIIEDKTDYSYYIDKESGTWIRMDKDGIIKIRKIPVEAGGKKTSFWSVIETKSHAAEDGNGWETPDADDLSEGAKKAITEAQNRFTPPKIIDGAPTQSPTESASPGPTSPSGGASPSVNTEGGTAARSPTASEGSTTPTETTGPGSTSDLLHPKHQTDLDNYLKQKHSKFFEEFPDYKFKISYLDGKPVITRDGQIGTYTIDEKSGDLMFSGGKTTNGQTLLPSRLKVGGSSWTPETTSSASFSRLPTQSGATPAAPAAVGGKVELTIGDRGPEGAIIDYFRDNHETAKKFGWDGNEDISKWAGREAHKLWVEDADEWFDGGENQKTMEDFLKDKGFTPNREGYTEMMHRIHQGKVEIDLDKKEIELEGMDYLKARPTVQPPEPPAAVRTTVPTEAPTDSDHHTSAVETGVKPDTSSPAAAAPGGRDAAAMTTEQIASEVKTTLASAGVNETEWAGIKNHLMKQVVTDGEANSASAEGKILGFLDNKYAMTSTHIRNSFSENTLEQFFEDFVKREKDLIPAIG